jgi:hypothetical protein
LRWRNKSYAFEKMRRSNKIKIFIWSISIERDRSPQSDLWIVSDRIKSVIWSKLRVILLWGLRLIRAVAKETHSDLGYQV